MTAPILTGKWTVDGEPLLPEPARYFTENIDHENEWKLVGYLPLAPSDTAAEVQAALAQVIARHEGLRLVFDPRRSSIEARLLDDDAEALATLMLSEEELALPDDPTDAVASLGQVCLGLQRRMALFGQPLLQCIYVPASDLTQAPHLILAIHHLVCDGTSFRILIKELGSNMERCRASLPSLGTAPPPSAPVLAHRVREMLERGRLSGDIEAWESIAPVGSTIPLEFGTADDNDTRSETAVVASLDHDSTKSLFQALRGTGISVKHALAAAVAGAVSSAFSLSSVPMYLIGHGRRGIFRELNPTRTIGWLSTRYPATFVRSPRAGEDDDRLAFIRKLRCVPHDGDSFGALRYLSQDAHVAEAMARLSDPQLTVNFVGQVAYQGEPKDVFTQPWRGNRVRSDAVIRDQTHNVYAAEVSGTLLLVWQYSTKQYSEETIRRLLADSLSRLSGAAASKGGTP